MTARIKPSPPPYAPEVQAQLDRLTPPGKQPLALFTLLAGHPRLFQRFSGGALLDKGHLTLRQRELVICRITARSGCEYEWGVHVTFFGQKAGLTQPQVESLARGSPDDACWPEDEERILIRACDALHETCNLDDDLWDALSRRFDEPARLELLMLAGFYRTVSYLANATRLPLESFAARFPPPRG